MSNTTTILRHFTKKGESVFDKINWKKFDAVIKDHKTQKIVFEQKDVEFPEFYSQRAVNIIASKYFRGVLGTKNRECSYKQLIARVVDTNVVWGEDQGYFQTDEDKSAFRQELTHILVHQKAYFNSPVWFTMGFPGREQTASACFINLIDDTLESIMGVVSLESKIFQRGSGSGVNMSSLRSRFESLSTGGTSSGVLSFMKVLDINAGVTKSGGATRRAAKMVILDIEHPEIVDFINCKVKEEEKAFALIREGYDPSYNGEAYSTISYQNANNSVRINDDFMQKAIDKKSFWTKLIKTGKRHKKYNADDVLTLIAEATWKSGDPGLQFHDAINSWNTCKSDECSSSNPCSEYLAQTDTSCNLASLNLMAFLDKETGEFLIDDFIHSCWIVSLAQDIWMDSAQYPSDKIEEETKKYRTIGLGYADLGSLLMSVGSPYDSDDGRDFASAVTSLMTAVAYERSMEFCSNLPAFPKWKENKKSMMDVLQRHNDETEKIRLNKNNKKIVQAAQKIWKKVVKNGEEKGFRNSYVSNIAPTGTISFAMDCETTGCEPTLALVVYKLLAGSDVTMEIVNQTVPIAFKNLGYDEKTIEKINNHILAHNSVEGCKDVKKKHVPIFDTSIGE
ncbi:adenosylcobalamin-dependent ribonucleoside-diphosphate reductase, partial [Candidatus Pacearchaeota archaeon]|nr:adenosylcobalamin-dependent ribonucleoside-diphosphate reductase [Candidatus Pacearchaeota archaeon]